MTTTLTPTKRRAIADGVDEIDRPSWLDPEQWPFALRRFEHRRPDGTSLPIHYTDEGSGPVLVFVHAGMWSFIWRDTIAALRSDFCCISLDFPGTGLSSGYRRDVDLSTFPDIVNAVLDHRGVARATFVIHDLGGVVGVLAAAARPDRIEGLVATNSFAWPPDRRSLKTMLAIVGSRTAAATLGTARVVPRMTRSKMGVGRHYDRADKRAFFGPYRRRRFARNFHYAMRSARQSVELYETAETALRDVAAGLPALTVFGEKNDPFGFADRWRSIFPEVESWTVPAGNHFPMCDDPDGYAAHLRDWHHAQVTS
jgi:haloalkane dehalogenase